MGCKHGAGDDLIRGYIEDKLGDPRMESLIKPSDWSVATDSSTKADLD
jgi:hypothetical protein